MDSVSNVGLGEVAAERSGRSTGAASLPVELAVVIPTFNERENVPVLFGRLAAALEG